MGSPSFTGGWSWSNGNADERALLNREILRMIVSYCGRTGDELPAYYGPMADREHFLGRFFSYQRQMMEGNKDDAVAATCDAADPPPETSPRNQLIIPLPETSPPNQMIIGAPDDPSGTRLAERDQLSSETLELSLKPRDEREPPQAAGYNEMEVHEALHIRNGKLTFEDTNRNGKLSFEEMNLYRAARYRSESNPQG